MDQRRARNGHGGIGSNHWTTRIELFTVDHMSKNTAREAATAHLQQASAAINTMFDRQDDVATTLTQISEIAASDSNVFARSQSIIDKAAQLTEQLTQLRDAAGAASEHRAKRDLARDLSASPNVVFPTSSTTTAPTTSEPGEQLATAS